MNSFGGRGLPRCRPASGSSPRFSVPLPRSREKLIDGRVAVFIIRGRHVSGVPGRARARATADTRPISERAPRTLLSSRGRINFSREATLVAAQRYRTKNGSAHLCGCGSYPLMIESCIFSSLLKFSSHRATCRIASATRLSRRCQPRGQEAFARNAGQRRFHAARTCCFVT